MQRIRRRKFGRDGASPHGVQATHVIKIGFDARAPNAPHPKPGRLPGFLICKDSVGPDGRLLVDMQVMQKLGYTSEQIKQAKKTQLKSPPGLLPTELHFVLTADAQRESGRWLYPSTFAEEYETWGKLGRLCHGDGQVASRRQNDGTRKQIPCVPQGSEGAPADTWCPYSVKGDCRGRSRLVLCLFVFDAKGLPQPVSDTLGWEARFRFDTSSGYNPLRFLEALDQAAERLNGNIAGIPGTISFLIQRKRTGKENSPVGIVGQVSMALSEHEIAKRERELWQRQIESKRLELPGGHEALPEHPEVETAHEEDQIILPVSPIPEESAEPPPEEPPEESPAKSVSREEVSNAYDTLVKTFPHTEEAVLFEIDMEWGAKNINEVPDSDLGQLLDLLRSIYMEAKREGGNQ